MNNSKTTVFEQLAASLPVEERRTLLNKISQSLKLNDKTKDYIKKDISRKELELKVKKDISACGWFERLIIRLHSFFTGKNSIDFFLQRELKRLKKRLRSTTGGSYFDSEDKKISGRLASEIYSLYVLAAPLKKIFMLIWYDVDFIENIYSNLIVDAIHTKKGEIYDFVSLEDMESIFAATGEKNQIRKKLINRMNEYLNSIPDKITGEISDILLPFYFAKFFISFPFKNFLNSFGCSITDLVEFRSPDFKKTDVSLVIERLEHLYYALILFTMIDWKDSYINIIGEAYITIYEQTESDLFDEKLQVLKKEIKSLANGINEFIKNTPLKDIIKYIKNDSYYEIICRIPKPDFFEFYSTALKIRILSSFTDIFLEVRKKYITTSIERIFLGYKLFDLNGYREYTDFNHKELNLNYFKHISSLMLINNFFTQYYKDRIFDLFQVLYKTVLIKNPSLQARFFELIKDIEKETIEFLNFDKSFLSNHEDGKTFSLLKNEIKKSPALLRKYKGFISEKDLAAERLIFSGLELLDNIRKNLEKILSNPADIIRLQLSSVYPQVNREKSLREIIKNLVGDVSNLTSLLKQNLDVEKS